MNHRDVSCEDGKCVEVFQDCVKWWVLVLLVLNHWVLLSAILLLWVLQVFIKLSGAFHTLFLTGERGLFFRSDRRSQSSDHFLFQTFAMQHISSGMCLSLPTSNGADGSLVLQACTQHVNQQWQLESVPWK
jgi:Ricin-type beta-trefoil lectin domain.